MLAGAGRAVCLTRARVDVTLGDQLVCASESTGCVWLCLVVVVVVVVLVVVAFCCLVCSENHVKNASPLCL